jgi:hypothetical protein
VLCFCSLSLLLALRSQHALLALGKQRLTRLPLHPHGIHLILGRAGRELLAQIYDLARELEDLGLLLFQRCRV